MTYLGSGRLPMTTLKGECILMKINKKQGFTIIELIIVIAVIAVLAAVLIPTFSALISRANESVDIQAARNMNLFLAGEKAIGEVKSIFDVRELFENSGYKVDSYTPLYKGRHYFYDTGYNQILYVDDHGTVLYPEEHKGEEKGNRNWMSLSMETIDGQKPSIYSESAATSSGNATITATATSAKELTYIVEKYNATTRLTNLALTIKGTIDMMGSSCAIKTVDNSAKVEIIGENNAVIKNLSSDKTMIRANNGGSTQDANYCASTLIGNIKAGASVEIKDITFENLNVKTLDGGNVGLLVAQVGGTLTMESVTINSSTVIGHRNVGAVVGIISNGGYNISAVVKMKNVSLNDVDVKTVGGRSAIVVGYIEDVKEVTLDNIVATNCTLRIYQNEESKQVFENADDNTAFGSMTFKGSQKKITSIKALDKTETATYAYRQDALFIVKTGATTAEFCDTLAAAQALLEQN